MVGAANCSMKNNVCNSFTYAEVFQMMSNIFLPCKKIFSNQQRQYLLRVCVYSHHGGKLIEFFFFKLISVPLLIKLYINNQNDY